MALRNLFDSLGKLNLPDIGVTTALYGEKDVVPYSNASSASSRNSFGSQEAARNSPFMGNNLVGDVNKPLGPVYNPYTAPAPSQNIRQPQVLGSTSFQQTYGPIQPSSSSSGGVTGAPSGAFSAGGDVAGATDQRDPYQDEQNRLERESEDRDRQFREQARGIFDPISQSFGTQLSRLPSELSQLRGGVESGAQSSRNLVGKQLEGSLNVLGQQEGNVRAETGKSLRNLAEDQRNTTTSISRQLGARGAGDTSAGDYAGAAIGRQGLKQRGSALESQATGLREIEGRRFEAKNIADQENIRIEQAKQQQLNSLAQDFQRIQRQLEDAKTTADSSQRRYIADQQNELRRELSQRLSDLEGETRQRKAALADWGAKQEIQLQNSLRLIAGKGAYDATDVMSNLSRAGSLAANLGYQATPQGAEYLQNTYVPGAPSGLFEPKPEKETEDDLGLGGLFTPEELAQLQ